MASHTPRRSQDSARKPANMYMLIQMPAHGTNGTKGHLKVDGLLWALMKIKDTKTQNAIMEKTMVTGSGKPRWNDRAEMKQATTNTRIRLTGMKEYRPPLYRSIITPAHIRLKAIKVPMEMASARISSVMKKAIPAVNIPVSIVPIRGMSFHAVVFWKNFGSSPYMHITKATAAFCKP